MHNDNIYLNLHHFDKDDGSKCSSCQLWWINSKNCHDCCYTIISNTDIAYGQLEFSFIQHEIWEKLDEIPF